MFAVLDDRRYGQGHFLRTDMSDCRMELGKFCLSVLNEFGAGGVFVVAVTLSISLSFLPLLVRLPFLAYSLLPLVVGLELLLENCFI